MKSIRFCGFTSALTCGLTYLTLVFLCPDLAAQHSSPVITSVQVRNDIVVVHVDVPDGVRRVTLESRLRLDAQTWTPVAVKQLDAQTREVVFDLPHQERLEVLRVRADFQQPLPQMFYTGTNAFGGPPTNTVPPGNYWDVVTGGPLRESDSNTREVIESDIWKIDGDRLYFFNQYRGLQVLDISEPDEARLLGTLRIPAAGEQMYLADAHNVVLLARQGCYYDDQSQVMIVGVTNGEPVVLKTLPVPGYIQESRMVGTALYVASQTYRPIVESTNTTWEWGSLVSSFDLADPTMPVARDQKWFPGYGHVIAATDTFLFVVTQAPENWRTSQVRIIDITAPDGAMTEYETVTSSGHIIDKFKMNYADGIFTTISEAQQSTGLVTRLETFRLPDPRTVPPVRIERLGSLELGHGERLHATRFDQNKVYVVTFFQIDPLWVVDLSNPSQPRIAGALEIPGWSTYIKPLGPRLLSVGVETNRVAVSLFDVSDPTKPGLLSRVLLGQNYSWTEANYDEKAFAVLEDVDLVLVPYSGDTTNGWTSRVQLIDLLPNELVARGVIEHEFQPRRATYTHGRVLSLSGTSLLSVDVRDRNEPSVTGETILAWAVDRLFLKDDFLLQISHGDSWWGGGRGAQVRVSSTSSPDDQLAHLTLGEFQIVGAALEGDRLYLAQNRSAWMSSEDQDTNTPNFLLKVVDVSALPELKLIGQSSNRIAEQWWGGASWEPIWPKPGVLVWAGGGAGGWPWVVGPMGRWDFWPGWYSSGGHFLCFDVTSGTDPKLVSEVNLQTNSWWDFSSPLLAGERIYISHTTSAQTSDDPKSEWVQRSFLDVIDYADPSNPVVRKPVNIPAKLAGVSHEGELLYTMGVHWTTNQTNWREWLDASAYDGVSAHLVASFQLPETWPHPVLLSGDAVLLGYADHSSGTPAYGIETWRLSMDGQFTRVAQLETPLLVSNMVKRDNLLVTSDYSNNLQMFDASDPTKLVSAGSHAWSGCFWVDITAIQGSLAEGVWVPLGWYGVLHTPPPARD